MKFTIENMDFKKIITLPIDQIHMLPGPRRHSSTVVPDFPSDNSLTLLKPTAMSISTLYELDMLT